MTLFLGCNWWVCEFSFQLQLVVFMKLFVGCSSLSVNSVNAATSCVHEAVG